VAGNEWLLVETLGSDTEPTVVAEGARFRGWTSLSRALRASGPAVVRAAADTVERCVDVPEARSRVVVDRLQVVAVPVVCAFGSVHGVQLWLGPDGEVPPPRRGVAAWDWLSDTELAHHGPGLEELVFARAAEDVQVVRTPPEVFGRMVRFDGRVAYLAVVAGSDRSGRWQGDVAFRGDDDRVRNFQLVVRVTRDARRVTRALVHETTDACPPQPNAGLAMTRMAARASDAGIGFVDLTTALIYEWTNDPPAPLDRWSTERPRLHPDDVAGFREACAKLYTGAVAGECELVVRVRFAGTGWLPVRTVLARLGGQPAHGLVRVWPGSAG
jgi:hypothetical protein